MSTCNSIKLVNYKRSGNPINSLDISICVIKNSFNIFVVVDKNIKKM